MEEASKKSDALKSLIQKVRLDTPSSDFTAVIMEEIMGEESTVAAESPLKSLLSRHGIEEAPDGLVGSVMTHVKQTELRPNVTPVISRMAWRLIILAVTSLGVLQFFSDQAAPANPGLTSVVIEVGSRLNEFFLSIPSLYLITSIAVAVLLLADHILRRQVSASK